MNVWGVDVGATNIEVGLIDEDNAVVERGKVPTPAKGPEAVADAVARLLEQVEGEGLAVGVGLPGVIDHGVITRVPNLPGWSSDTDFTALLADHVDLPIVVGNDANLGVLGEWVAGAGRGAHNVLGVWLGTGVGGGLILDGRPYTGARGAAGEVGHMIVRQGGALCGCGRRGCIEAYAGRQRMASTVETRLAAGADSRLRELQEEKGKKRLTSSVWAAALEEGDTLATAVIDEAVRVLGAGIGSIVNLLDLERVIIGGGLAEKLGQDLADRVGKAARPWMMQAGQEGGYTVEFLVAELGDDSGVVGAAISARATLLGQ